MKKTIPAAFLALALTACGSYEEGSADRAIDRVQILELKGSGTKSTILERYCDGTTGITVVKSGFTGEAGGILETPDAPYCE
jgi:hypothetical protein